MLYGFQYNLLRGKNDLSPLFTLKIIALFLKVITDMWFPHDCIIKKNWWTKRRNKLWDVYYLKKSQFLLYGICTFIMFYGSGFTKILHENPSSFIVSNGSWYKKWKNSIKSVSVSSQFGNHYGDWVTDLFSGIRSLGMYFLASLPSLGGQKYCHSTLSASRLDG